MKPRRADAGTLWGVIARAGLPPGRMVSDASESIALATLAGGTTLDRPAEDFRGKTVLLVTRRQLPAALALAELDGIAARLLLCPPGLAPAQLAAAVAANLGGRIDTLLSDDPADAELAPLFGARFAECGLPVIAAARSEKRRRKTQWLLFTSGTGGLPKLVVHSLASLIGPALDGIGASRDAVWSTFYDIRRYGGLQVLLRAFLGGGSMVFAELRDGVAACLALAGARGVTHMSGTPTHWRQALMSLACGRMNPGYIRLSGEVADQSILDRLAREFPASRVAHAFASTEAGVAFDVTDGLAGFPAALIDTAGGGVAMKVRDGTLRIRSPRNAAGYAGVAAASLLDEDGFVDTGDLVALHDGRYHFTGRRGGIINVGGNKVSPEEVEAIIGRHPDVQMSLVRARSNPITGAVVVADVVARPGAVVADGAAVLLRDEILRDCRAMLDAHKVPALLRLVTSIEVAPSGKLLRTGA